MPIVNNNKKNQKNKQKKKNLKMSQKLLNIISNSNSQVKNTVLVFIKNLYKKERKEKDEDQYNILQIFKKYTFHLSIQKAREVSKNQRYQRLLINRNEFNYGQITFQTIYEIFEKIKTLRKYKDEQIFYDLGSGTGKVVFAAALCYPFIKCVGIQFLQQLYKFSKELQSKIYSQKSIIQTSIKNWKQQFKFPKIQFVNGDFKQIDWKDGTIIFASTTCYNKQIMSQISNLCNKLQKGAIIITLTKKLDHVNQINLKLAFQGTTSWGNSTVYIHMKQ